MAPPNPQLLQDVIARGRAALDEWRQQRNMGAAGPAGRSFDARQQVLGAFRGSVPAQSQATRGDVFDRIYGGFQQQYGNQPSQVVYGQSPKGAYAGFKNASDLWNAIEGRGSMMRDLARQQAGDLRGVAQGRLDELTGQYDTSNLGAFKNAWGAETANAQAAIDARRSMPTPPSAPTGSRSYSTAYGYHPDPNVAASAGDIASGFGDYQTQLNTWLANQSDPYAQALEAADQIDQTPISVYDRAAGAAYGVDPNITAGRFGAQEDYTDYGRQRNLDAIASYGLPYDEVLALQKQVTGEQNTAAKDAEDAQMQAIADEIGAQTGMDAHALAQSADLTIPQLAQAVTDPAYQSATAALQQVLANPEDENAAADFEATMRQVGAQRPDLYRLLQAQFGSFEPNGFDYFPTGQG